MTNSITVRVECETDIARVREITQRAFAESELGHNGEANLVDQLRVACPESVSLVAEMNDQIVGHILFTPATIDTGERSLDGMGLAPMSVLPEYQRRGVGTKLVQEGMQLLQKRRQPFVIVLGHPEYYPRFGFVLASLHSIACEFENIPDELFMIRIFDANALEGIVEGVAKYRPEFRSAPD